MPEQGRHGVVLLLLVPSRAAAGPCCTIVNASFNAV